MHPQMHLAHEPKNEPENAPENGRICTAKGAEFEDATVRMTAAKPLLRPPRPVEEPAKQNAPSYAPAAPARRSLEALVRDFVALVRCECGEDLERDTKTLRAAVLRLVRRELPLRRGRPNDPRIDAAVRMREQGKSIKEILELQTRNFDKVDTYGRYLAEKGLRTAVTRRHKRTRSAPHK